MNRSYYGLYIPNLVWREIENFSSGAVCLVLASLPFDEQDYFRDYEEFIQHVAVSGQVRNREDSVGEVRS